jgi:hypothetical protein
MSVTYVSADLRRQLVARAGGMCEYCLMAEEDTFYGCEVDHVISEKHGGPTEAENLAYACVFCNRAKGTDIGSVVPGGNVFVRFFNPRTDRWADHFVLVGSRIEGKTDIGVVTARILEFNNGERILERETLAAVNRYPSPGGRARMQS